MTLIFRSHPISNKRVQPKEFLANKGLSEIKQHLELFISKVDKSDPSVEMASYLLRQFFESIRQGEGPGADLTIELKGLTSKNAQNILSDNGLTHPNSGRPLKGQISKICQHYGNLINFWLYNASVESILAARDVWPLLEINPNSSLATNGALANLNNLEKLAVFATTKAGIDRANDYKMFTSSFSIVTETITLAYAKRAIRKDSPYKGTIAYVLREYIISGKWKRDSIDISDLLSIKNRITLASKNSTYSLSPLIETLSTFNFISLNGRILNELQLLDYHTKQPNHDAAYLKEMRARRYRSNQNSIASIMNKSKVRILDTYETGLYGKLVCRDLIDNHFYFSQEVENHNLAFRPDKLNDKDELSKKNHKTFAQLFSFQRDFLSNEERLKRSSTLKGKRSSLVKLNRFLCGYLYEFSMKHGYGFLDCSGKNFLKTKLAIAFSDSDLIAESFENDLGCKIRPVTLKKWMITEFGDDHLSGNVHHKFLRDCISFFEYCETISGQTGIDFKSPLPHDFSKGYSFTFKETAKEVFEFTEWIVWNELTNKCFSALLNLYERNQAEVGHKIKEQHVLDALAAISELDILKKVFGVEVRLSRSMVDRAFEAYMLQYDGNSTTKVRVEAVSFANCIGAITLINNSGLRVNSVANLPFYDLVTREYGLYSAINVIADKVSDSGFSSIVSTEVLERVFQFRKAASKLFPSEFKKLRKIERPNEDLEIDGLFGTNHACDENRVSVVCDFMFYLFNELVQAVNNQSKAQLLNPIPIVMLPQGLTRGTNMNHRLNQYPGDVLVVSYDVLENSDIEFLANILNPACMVRAKPNRTVHSLRASFVTNYSIAGVGADVIGYFTGQKVRTVVHYVKASLGNLTLLEREGHLSFIEKILKGEIQPFVDNNSLDIQSKIHDGVIKAGGLICAANSNITFDQVETIYRSGSKHIAIHPTHLCPHNDECPPDIQKQLEYQKNCAICPVSVSFVTDIPAISQKINYDLSQAKLAQDEMKKTPNDKQKKVLNVRWQEHFKQAAQWIVRYEMLAHQNRPVVGGRVFDDGKQALLEFNCEDNHVLSDLLTMLEARNSYAYQSEEMKNKARMLQARLSRIDDLDPDMFMSDPVESLCRTVQKQVSLHKMSLEDIKKMLSSSFDLSSAPSVTMANLLSGGRNE